MMKSTHRLPSAGAGTLYRVNQRKAWIVYIVLRLVFFAVPFAALYLIGWPAWLAVIVAALIALSLSVIFLQRQRDVASESVYEWRQRKRTHDDIVEDEVIDSLPSDQASDQNSALSHDAAPNHDATAGSGSTADSDSTVETDATADKNSTEGQR